MGMLLRRHYEKSAETISPQKESVEKEKSKKEKPAKKQVKSK